jgi:hypothetical protein
MALLGNVSQNQRNPQRHFGLLSAGTAFVQGNEMGGWRQHGMSKNFSLHDGQPTGGKKTGYPSGRMHPYSWSMPLKTGGMAAILTAEGSSTATAIPISLVGTIAGTATATGSIAAPTAAVGTSAGIATATADRTAIAWCYGTSAGTGTATIVSYATGQLQGAIAPAVDLDAASFSTYLLDTELVETGLTVRETLRIAISALGGKVAISGNTVTFRDVNDTVDRITATTDSNGQRTAVTLDAD